MMSTEKMKDWKTRFEHDPTTPLARCDDTVIRHSYEIDIEGSCNIEISEVWSDKRVLSILKKQRSDGSWRYQSKSSSMWKRLDYDQYETFRKLGFVAKFTHSSF
jgi:hypothetical protein